MIFSSKYRLSENNKVGTKRPIKENVVRKTACFLFSLISSNSMDHWQLNAKDFSIKVSVYFFTMKWNTSLQYIGMSSWYMHGMDKSQNKCAKQKVLSETD